MSRHCYSQFWYAALLLLTACAYAAAPCIAQTSAPPTSKPAASGPSEKMTPQTRIMVIKSLQSERVFARVLFPQGDKGLKIKNGVVSPSDMVIAQQVSEFGAAAKPGDRCVITDVKITDKDIVLEINGGPKKKGKWYQHIQISGGGGASSPLPGTPSPQSLDAHGSVVTLEFEKFVPDVNGDQVRAMLNPVFDFKALTASEAYQKTLPPKIQEAIRDHKILVGMDKEMVMYSKGRPQQRIRDKDDKGEDYEEWIYGVPPQEVTFVRFHGDEVSQIEIMQVDGQKVVRTEKEIDKAAINQAHRQQEAQAGEQPGGGAGASAEAASSAPPANPADIPDEARGPKGRPSLRRPGEPEQEPATTISNPPVPRNPSGPTMPNPLPPNPPSTCTSPPCPVG